MGTGNELMSNLGNDAENMAATWLFTTTAVTRPTSWTLQLFTSATDDASGGTQVTGGSYVPIALGSSLTVTNNIVSNTAAIVSATATANWGTVTHARIVDQLGRSLAHGPLGAPQAINSGNSFRIDTGALALSFD